MLQLPNGYRKFQEKHSQGYAAYETLGKIAAKSGPLDEKTRELIKLCMAAA
ncbi:MAG: carboxymuconolactone decarboxylase family protein [Chloroflexi bacterium]|nr:carboxymuconolactone decarboxylase family protein [Chloroflexota bacterium]